jgi:hypothetical protein
MNIRPRVRTARPIQGQKKQRAGDDEEERPDGIDGPDVLFDSHFRVVRTPGWVVEEDKAEKGGEMECCLHPVDVSPARRARIRDASGTETTNTAISLAIGIALWKLNLQPAHGATKESKAVGQSSVLERQDFTRNGLHDGDRAQCHTDQNSASDEHRHGGSFGRHDGTREGNQWWYGCQPFSVKDIAESADDWR